ncbi:MAG: Hpt domain-containing protein [Clostridiales Family XIII bacterium]|jgi:HPt (histidine-containing phosphotransfer) domain-containing protein|nr:Hpt domain-containing protein [Clostridiales Family XIII bacterium]
MGAADSKYIDLTSGLPRVANNEKLYKKLVAKFEASVDISALDAALSGGDYIKAGEIVHAAKGVAGNLSLAAFYDNSVVLMDQLRGGNPPAQENVDSFKRLYNETVRAINTYLED